MKNVVLHPISREQLENFILQPSHALLLTGNQGMGKYFIAKNVIAQILGIDIEQLQNNPYVSDIKPEGKSISIQHIRELQHFIKLKPATIKSNIVRAILIENAELLTTEAQNAFLKVLEEPPRDTLIVLTANNIQSLLPTIISRVQHISIKKPLNNDIVRHFENSFEMSEITRVMHISAGRVGLMNALLGDTEHPLVQYIAQAKKIYTQNSFERLLFVEDFIKSKQNLDELLQGLYIVSRAAMYQAAEKQNNKAVRRWVAIQTRLLKLENSLMNNPQTKLALSNFMMHL